LAIIGRTPNACFEQFRAHVSTLISATLGQQYVHFGWEDDTKGTISLGPANSHAGVRLESGRGEFYLALKQNLEAVKVEQSYQLKTRGYRYAISQSGELFTEASIRWEYTHKPPAGRQCRHHFQLGRIEQKAPSMDFNGVALDLNRLHTPTGFVLIEYVLRFIFTDMDVTPISFDWENRLSESEDKFFTEFSGRTSTPPG